MLKDSGLSTQQGHEMMRHINSSSSSKDIDKVTHNASKVDVQVGNVSEGHMNTLRSITSAHGAPIRFVDAKSATSDQQVLAEIGYKEELRREFSTVQIFGVAFSIMGLLPSIASTMDGGLSAGPVGLNWGWFVGGGLILTIGIALAEISSSMPTAGAVYVSCYQWAPQRVRKCISYSVGFLDTLSLSASVCSIVYGLAQQILSAVVVTNPDFNVTNGITYGVFAACIVSMGLLTSLASKFSSKLQTFSIVANCFLIILFFIVLPIGVSRSDKLDRKFNDGKFIFGNSENLSDWNTGWNWCISGMTPAIWTIGAYDSCVHMAEEARDAVRAVPIGIVGSIASCWILGWLICIVLLACMDSDINNIVNSAYGQGITQVFYDALGKRWTLTFLSLIIVCQFLMGASTVIANSRQFWAFARDDGIPFSNFFKKVSGRVAVPIRAVWGSCLLSLALGLLCLAGETAADALFSLSIAGMYMALIFPITLRLTYGRKDFRPGPFYLGDIWSPIVNWVAVFYQAFIIVMVMFPSQQHGTTPDTMNYTVVIGPGFWVLSLCYYFVWQRKFYQGPKSNLTDEEYEQYVGEDVIDAIISSNAQHKSERLA
ncbi:LAMI_0C02938g1_1 [Lachancea mirantina]|uniref:LAMI_0C02938g1_1 n=1 Tax=Lachancea mirantina TaxID=1230905 RepID=A0A1G4J1A9_9SACH|nr:LAMI_0C02938g1_1 [Lachancea mirantina]